MMNENFAIQLFEGKKIRIVWNAEQEKYYFAGAHGDSGEHNSSTTSLLRNAGVDDNEIDRIESNIPRIVTGFGSVKPWTKEQREFEESNQREIRKMNESISNHIGF